MVLHKSHFSPFFPCDHPENCNTYTECFLCEASSQQKKITCSRWITQSQSFSMPLKLPWNTNDSFSLCNVTHFRMRLNLWEGAFKSDHMCRKTHFRHLHAWSRRVSLNVSYLSCSTCELITKRKKYSYVRNCKRFNFVLLEQLRK